MPALFIAVALALFPGDAAATLGETAQSVPNDSARLKASLRVSSAGPYTVHQLTLPTGTIVREYVNGTGTVFAVSWRGPHKPDLPAILGRYFDTYATAPRSAGSDRSHLTIDQDNLVVRAGGHQRAFAGLAYVPQFLPAGVSAADIQADIQ